jgi:general stress protein 26
MSGKTLETIAEAMRDIEFCMFSTRTEGGALATCPMSTNREVDYDGTSRFFSYEDNRPVLDIKRHPEVSLAFQGRSGDAGGPPLFIAAAGEATLTRDKDVFAEHWTDGLRRWIPDGIDTPGLVMITVTTDRVHYWEGEDEGEIVL